MVSLVMIATSATHIRLRLSALMTEKRVSTVLTATITRMLQVLALMPVRTEVFI
jgi:hypothetical protein